MPAKEFCAQLIIWCPLCEVASQFHIEEDEWDRCEHHDLSSDGDCYPDDVYFPEDDDFPEETPPAAAGIYAKKYKLNANCPNCNAKIELSLNCDLMFNCIPDKK